MGQVDVAAPGVDWTASGPIRFETGDGYIVNASRSDADVETTPVDFTGRDLVTLDPSEIIVRDAEVWTRTKDADAQSPATTSGWPDIPGGSTTRPASSYVVGTSARRAVASPAS